MKKILFSVISLLAFSASAQISQPVGPGGRPQTFTAHGVLVGQGTSNVVPTSAGTAGLCLVSGGASADPAWASCAAGAAGTVTNVSVVSANGMAGTVATPTTTPAITLTTTATGVLKGNGTAISAATAGTDYSAGTSALATGIVKSTTSTGALSIAASGTDYAPPTSGSSILSGSGAGGFANVTVGTGLTFSGGTLSASGAAGLSVINGYISGYGLSNDGTTPNTTLDIAAGVAADSSNAVMINGTAFTKKTSGAWAVGTGSNGMGNALTVAANTWYHVFSIINGGNFDIYFDTSTSAANKPAGTTAFRYIGSIKTDGSSNIVAFKQLGQTFYWVSSLLDMNAGTSTSLVPVTLSAPAGFNTYPILNFNCGGSSGTAILGSPLVSGSTPTLCDSQAAGNVHGYVSIFSTNTSSQLNYQITGSTSLTLRSFGYINPYTAINP